MYLIKSKEQSYNDFSEAMLKLGTQVASIEKVGVIKINLTIAPPPKFTVIPFKKNKVCVISAHQLDSTPIEILTKAKGFIGSYLADEAIPVAYDKKWEDFKPTPGACLLTLFKQKKGLDYDLFIDRWHNSHTPLSLKIHPLWNYNRNVITKKLTSNSEQYDGIVEEQFRTPSDLLNVIKFFGPIPMMFYRMLQVYTDTKSFIDYKSIEPYYTTEICIKS